LCTLQSLWRLSRKWLCTCNSCVSLSHSVDVLLFSTVTFFYSYTV